MKKRKEKKEFLLSFLFSLDSGGKGRGRAVLKSCLLLGVKPMLK